MGAQFSAIEDDPSNYDIRTAAEEVYETAWKLRGEQELMYIPENSEFKWAVGKTRGEIEEAYNSGGPGDQNLTRLEVIGGFYPGEDGRYGGTPEQWQSIRDAYDWIVPSFEKFSEPLAILLLEPANQMASVSEALYNSKTGEDSEAAPRTTAGSAINTWTGSGSVAFKLNVWNRLPEITKRQSFFAMSMGESLAAAYQAYVEQRKSALDVAKKAKLALEATVVEATDNSAADLTILAGVATVVAGTFTLPFSGGLSGAAVGAGISTIIAGVATTAAGEASRQPLAERKKLELGADTVTGVLLNMIDRCSDIRTDLDEAETRIAGAFDEYMEVIQDTSKPSGSNDEATFSKRDNLMFPAPSSSDLGPAESVLPPGPTDDEIAGG